MIVTHSWGGAKIQQDFALLEEAIFLVELDELEGGTGSVSLFFRKLVPLVKTTLSVLLLDRHGFGVGGCAVRCEWDGRLTCDRVPNRSELSKKSKS